MINILTQRLDVCEKEFTTKYEQQLQRLQKSQDQLKHELNKTREKLRLKDEEMTSQIHHLQQSQDKLKQELNETKEQLNETKEQFNETKEQLNETNEQLNETKKQLRLKDEEMKNNQDNVSQRLEALEKNYQQQLQKSEKYRNEIKEQLKTKVEKLEIQVNKSDVEILSKKIGEDVLPVKRGEWFNVEFHNLPLDCNTSTYSCSYITDDGCHFKMRFYYTFGYLSYDSYYYLQLYVFKDMLKLKRGTNMKRISYEICDIKKNKQIDFNEQCEFHNTPTNSRNRLCAIQIPEVKRCIVNGCLSFKCKINDTL